MFSPSEKPCVCFWALHPIWMHSFHISFHIHNHSFSWLECLILPSLYWLFLTCLCMRTSFWVDLLSQRSKTCLLHDKTPIILFLAFYLFYSQCTRMCWLPLVCKAFKMEILIVLDSQNLISDQCTAFQHHLHSTHQNLISSAHFGIPY